MVGHRSTPHRAAWWSSAPLSWQEVSRRHGTPPLAAGTKLRGYGLQGKRGHHIDRQVQVLLEVEQPVHDNAENLVRVLFINGCAQIHAFGIVSLVHAESGLRIAGGQQVLQFGKRFLYSWVCFGAMFSSHTTSPPFPWIASTNWLALRTARATCRSLTCAGS